MLWAGRGRPLSTPPRELNFWGGQCYGTPPALGAGAQNGLFKGKLSWLASPGSKTAPPPPSGVCLLWTGTPQHSVLKGQTSSILPHVHIVDFFPAPLCVSSTSEGPQPSLPSMLHGEKCFTPP